MGLKSELNKGWDKITSTFTGKKKENKPTNKNKSTSNSRRKVQIENQKQAVTSIEKKKNTNANNAIKIHHKGGEVPPLKQEVEKAGSKLWQGTVDTLDRTGNATRTGLNYFQTNKNAVEGIKKGFKLEERTSGRDVINNNQYLTKGLEAPVNLLVKDKAKNEKIKNNVKDVAGFGLEIGADPLSYVSFGGGGFAKGLVSGVGGTVAKETAEAGAKIAGKQLIRATAGKGLKADDLLKAIKNVPDEKRAPVMQELVKQVKTGGSVGKYSDDVSKLAGDAYEQVAKTMAKKQGFDMQKMLDAKAGSGIKIGKKTLVSSSKMRDAGAKVNKALLGGQGTGGRKANDLLMETMRKGYKAGLTDDEYHLLRMIDASARGYSAKGFDRALENISSVAKGATKGDEAVVRRMLERGADTVINPTAKQMQMYKALKKMGGDIAEREVTTGMLGADRVLEHYMPRVKSTGIKAKDATKISKNETYKQLGRLRKELNPQLRSSKSRKIDSMSVRYANKLLSESVPELAGKKFFEESPTKAFALRAKDHYDKMAQKFRADDIINSVGRKIDLNELQELAKPTDGVKGMMKRSPEAKIVQRSTLMQIPLDGNGTTLGDIVDIAGEAGEEVVKILKQGGFKGDPTALAHIANKLIAQPDEILTNLSSKDFKSIASVMQTNLPKGADLPVYALPNRVLSSIIKPVTQELDDVSSSALKVIDGAHGLWKPLKTSLSPLYYLNNVLGGTANTIMDVGLGRSLSSIPDTAKILAGGNNATIRAGGRQYTAKQLRDIMEASNVTSSNFARADLKTVNRYIDDATKGGGFLRHPVKSIMDRGSKLTDATETGIRTHEMVANLKKGLDPISAGERVKMHQFDYGDLSDFEKKVMKRIMPFYTYKSKNVPTQLGKLLDNPVHHYRMLERLPKLVAENREVDYDSKPAYLKEQAPIFTGRNDIGMPQYFTPSFPQTDIYTTPITGGLKKSLLSTASMTTPLVKTGAEMLWGGKLMPYGKMEDFDTKDERTPAYFMGKQIPHSVQHFMDTISPVPNLKYFDTENLRGKVVQPIPETLGFMKEFDEIGYAKQSYSAREAELQGIIDAMKNAGMTIPSIDKIIGRKDSRKYQAGVKNKYLQSETLQGYDPVNPDPSNFSEAEYAKILSGKQQIGNVPDDFKVPAGQTWADYILSLLKGGN